MFVAAAELVIVSVAVVDGIGVVVVVVVVSVVVVDGIGGVFVVVASVVVVVVDGIVVVVG